MMLFVHTISVTSESAAVVVTEHDSVLYVSVAQVSAADGFSLGIHRVP